MDHYFLDSRYVQEVLPNLCCNLLYNMIQDFLDRQYWLKVFIKISLYWPLNNLLDVHDLLVQVEADGVTDDLLQLVVLTVKMLLQVLIAAGIILSVAYITANMYCICFSAYFMCT